MSTETIQIDSTHFRTVLSHFCSGITVVTSTDDSGPIGLTCQSFFSVSIDPPLIALCVSSTSTTFPRIRATGSFTVNVLAADQHQVSNAFARSGTDKWAGINWQPGTVLPHPIIDGTLATLECELDSEIEAGDHHLVVGRVLNLQATPDRQPLIYYRGTYNHLNADNLAS